VERRLAIPAGTTRQKVIVALALVLASMPAHAAPKGREAKAAFDRGVTAYQKQDYAAASEALRKSFELESDVETLFAWAQAERQQDHCDQAIVLYEKLLALELPDENRRVIADKLDECKALVAVLAPEPERAPEPTTTLDESAPPAPASDSKEASPRWWKDPIGGALAGVGVVGLGVGGYFLLSARNADADAKNATNYFEAEDLNAKAESRGRNGVIASLVGGGLLAGGIVWYATRTGKRSTTVSGWLAPSGGGVTALRRF
jgi:tetratricopeptide (TPR) repeat protein